MMQMKKVFKISAVIFCVLALLSLLLPFYSTYLDGGESYNMAVRGYNASEFSVWGGMIIVLPITLIGITCYWQAALDESVFGNDCSISILYGYKKV